MLLKVIEMVIQLTMCAENIIYQECHYIDGIKHTMELENL